MSGFYNPPQAVRCMGIHQEEEDSNTTPAEEGGWEKRY
jgi:hypothetical protein